ncbi:hypothetical protein KUM39_22780 [Streptomyces sp. J2-1]|nr:zinc ribbon domain-containing protein [Streptomyces corallincola]MBV2357164.1 hypothetical protein [Streptomyces corallincola]
MYHHSATVSQLAGGSTAGLLDPARTEPARRDPARMDTPRATPPRDTLTFQRCTWCGTATYHRLLCPVCQGSELRTEHSEGVGTIRHATIVHRNTPGARNVSMVELTEGFVVRGRVMGPLIGIHSGDRVRLSTAKDPVRGEPVFQLVDEPCRAWT